MTSEPDVLEQAMLGEQLSLAATGDLPFVVRDYDESTDKAYVLDSWLKGRLGELTQKYNRRKRMTVAQRHEWFTECRPRFAALLQRKDVQVLVACDPERPWRILGYAVFAPGDHWEHVQGWCASFRDLILAALRERAAVEAP